MQYTGRYASPIGEILLAADNEGLTGLWFADQKYFAAHLDEENEERDTAAIKAAREWLDEYFAGNKPAVEVPLHIVGTPFQNEVWEILLSIPYGKTMTYGEIAQRIAKKRGLARMSAQAVGGAVGHNNISIIVPCHRVVGSNGSLTGYAGGISKKIELLKIESVCLDGFFVPKNSTAP